MQDSHIYFTERKFPEISSMCAWLITDLRDDSHTFYPGEAVLDVVSVRSSRKKQIPVGAETLASSRLSRHPAQAESSLSAVILDLLGPQ